ncbi:hypothetical protein JL721_11205 [Aureococcus anophagefferens]|nr:hypothetical protein JL721_11205 [Aureococcus anophagefferens]
MRCKAYDGGPEGKGGYYDPALFSDVLAPYDAEPAAAAAAAAPKPDAPDDAAPVIADRTCAVMDACGWWADCQNQHSSTDAALLELLDNVDDEAPTRFEAAVRRLGADRLGLGLRNDVRGPEVARVDQAVTLARSLKRGRDHSQLIGENGVGLKAAAAKLGACAFALSVHPAQIGEQIRREDGVAEAAPLGSAVFTVGVLARSLQEHGQAPCLPVCSFFSALAAGDIAAAWRSAKGRPAGKLVEKVAEEQGFSVAEACRELGAFCLDDAGAPRDASRPSAFEVVLAETALPAHDLAGRLKELLRGPTYLERGYEAVAVDPSGSETVAPHSLLATLLEPARREIKVGPADDDVVTVLVGFCLAPADVAAAARPSPLLVYTCGRLVERHDDWRLALDLQELTQRAYRKEYAFGLTVVIIDEKKVLEKTHTKQQIVDDEAYRAAKNAAARFAASYYVAFHKRTWVGGGGTGMRLDIATHLAYTLDTCADRAAEREPLDPPRLRDANLVSFDGTSFGLEDASRPGDVLRVAALLRPAASGDEHAAEPAFPPRPTALAIEARPPPRAAARPRLITAAPQAVATAACFGVGTECEAKFRGQDYYAARVVDCRWMSVDDLRAHMPNRGPYTSARAVFAVRFAESGTTEPGLFEEDAAAVGEAPAQGDGPPRRGARARGAAAPAKRAKPSARKKAKQAPKKAAPRPRQGSAAARRRPRGPEARAPAPRVGVARADRHGRCARRGAWVRAVRTAKSPRAVLDLAVTFERDAWIDAAKFETWRGTERGAESRRAGVCAGALDPLHAMRFPGLGAPVLVADVSTWQLRAAALAAASGEAVVARRGPPEKRLRVVEGVKRVVHISASDGDDAVTLKRLASDLIHVVAVDAADPSGGLVGQSKAIAKIDVAKHEVIGAYAGRLWTDDTFRQARGHSIPGMIEHERYSYDLFDGDDAMIVDPWPGLNEPIVGGELMAINDCRVDPLEGNAGQNRYNCEFAEVHIRGFPHLFVVATATIAKGEELLIDYGPAYWNGRRALEKYLVTFRECHPPEKLERLRRALTAPRAE